MSTGSDGESAAGGGCIWYNMRRFHHERTGSDIFEGWPRHVADSGAFRPRAGDSHLEGP